VSPNVWAPVALSVAAALAWFGWRSADVDAPKFTAQCERDAASLNAGADAGADGAAWSDRMNYGYVVTCMQSHGFVRLVDDDCFPSDINVASPGCYRAAWKEQIQSRLRWFD
jgi:hypothetical protein